MSKKFLEESRELLKWLCNPEKWLTEEKLEKNNPIVISSEDEEIIRPVDMEKYPELVNLTTSRLRDKEKLMAKASLKNANSNLVRMAAAEPIKKRKASTGTISICSRSASEDVKDFHEGDKSDAILISSDETSSEMFSSESSSESSEEEKALFIVPEFPSGKLGTRRIFKVSDQFTRSVFSLGLNVRASANPNLLPHTIRIRGVKVKKVPIVRSEEDSSDNEEFDDFISNELKPSDIGERKFSKYQSSFVSKIVINEPAFDKSFGAAKPAFKASTSFVNDRFNTTIGVNVSGPTSVKIDLRESVSTVSNNNDNVIPINIIPMVAAKSNNVNLIEADQKSGRPRVCVLMTKPIQYFTIETEPSVSTSFATITAPKLDRRSFSAKKPIFIKNNNQNVDNSGTNLKTRDTSCPEDYRSKRRQNREQLKELIMNHENVRGGSPKSDEFPDEINIDAGAGRIRNRKHLPTLATWKNGLEVGPSTIPKAGRGVFAARPFKKNDFVTQFEGRLISREEACTIRESRKGGHLFMRGVDYHNVIDGIKEPVVGLGLGSFVNDPIKSEYANCIYKKQEESNGEYVIYLKATKDILVGEELFVSYGSGYWREAAVDNEDKGLLVNRNPFF